MRIAVIKSVSLAHAKFCVYLQICLEERNPICQELSYVTDKNSFFCLHERNYFVISAFTLEIKTFLVPFQEVLNCKLILVVPF